MPGSRPAIFAVGYLFPSGLETVVDTLHNTQELRVLVGITSSRETIGQIAEGYHGLDLVRKAVKAVQYPKRTNMDASAVVVAGTIGRLT